MKVIASSLPKAINTFPCGPENVAMQTTDLLTYITLQRGPLCFLVVLKHFKVQNVYD